MPPRSVRAAVGIALVSAAVWSPSALAVNKPLVLTDATGDANGLHDQGTGTFGSGTSTPVSFSGKDVLSLTLAPLPGKQCTGYTAVIELAGSVSTNTVYHVAGTTQKNSSRLWLQWDNNPVGETTSKLLWDDGSGLKSIDLATPTKIDSSKLTLTVTEKDLKKANEELASINILLPSVDVRSSTGAVMAPSWDVLSNEDKNFKPCS